MSVFAKIQRIIFELPKMALYALYHIVYGFSFLIPRDKKLWIFDEWKGQRCGDNPRYLYLYINRHQPDIQAIWLTKSQAVIDDLRVHGFKAHKINSLAGLWYTLRAKVIVYESTVAVFYWLTGGMIKINLWHGIPIKKIVYDSVKTKHHNWVFASTGLRRMYHMFFNPEKADMGDYILVQSNAWKNFFASAFRTDPSRLIVENQPRYDIFTASIQDIEVGSEKEPLKKLRELRKSKKIVMYLPTFRDGSGNPLDGSGLDFGELDTVLEKNNMHMFVKMHHEKIPTDGTAGYSHIDFLPADCSANQILSLSDILLTDFSSVFFEYLPTNKPVMFFPFDYERYMRECRELYFDYHEITPGPKAYTAPELFNLLEEAGKGIDHYKTQRQKIRDMVENPEINRASERVFEKIRAIVEK